MTVPLVRQFTLDVTSLAASADFSAPMGRAPYACVVTLVEYIPAATQTDDTGVANTGRNYSLYNRGGAPGTGTTVLARAIMTSASASIVGFGTSTSAGLTDNIASTLPLTTSTAFLTLAAGDILEWESSHVGSTGLRDVGGRVVVTYSRV